MTSALIELSALASETKQRAEQRIREELERLVRVARGCGHDVGKVHLRIRWGSRTTGSALAPGRNGLIWVTIGDDDDWAHTCMVLAHELTHVIVGWSERHGDRFRSVYIELIHEAYGVEVVGDFGCVYQTRSSPGLDGAVAAALRARVTDELKCPAVSRKRRRHRNRARVEGSLRWHAGLRELPKSTLHDRWAYDAALREDPLLSGLSRRRAIEAHRSRKGPRHHD